MKKKILTFFVLLFSLIGCLPLRSSVDVVDTFKENKELNINNRKYSNSETVTNENPLMTYELTIEDNIVSFNEDICILVEEVEAQYSYSASITNSTFFVQDTITINGSSTEFKVRNNHASGEHSFDVNVISSDNEVLYNKTIYIYSDGLNDYVSASCFEESRDLYYREVVADEEDLVLLGLEEEIENISFDKTRYGVLLSYLDFIHSLDDYSYDDLIIDDVADDKIIISGRVLWLDEKDNKHPLSFNSVILEDDDTVLFDFIRTTNTDQEGYFEFEIDETTWSLSGFDDFLISIYPSNDAATVKLNNMVCYPIISDKITEATDTKSIYCEFELDNNSIRTDAFEISQMMLYPHFYAEALSGDSLPGIPVCYPSIMGSYYLSGFIGIERIARHDWDVGTHEYGHYVVDAFNMAEMIPGPHFFDVDVSDNHQCRYTGCALALSKGLATYLGISSQLYYNLSALRINQLGDNRYKDYGFKKSEANEASIAYFLMDLMDNDNSPNDTISLGHQEVWDMLEGSNFSSISDFIQELDTDTINRKNQIGLLEEYYRFSAKNLSSSNILNLTVNNNTFSWSANISGESLSKLSYYDLVFYSSDLLQTYKIEDIEAINNGDTVSYTLTLNDLNALLGFNTTTIYWQVIGYNDRYGFWDEYSGVIAETLTGGYISSLETINKPTYNQSISYTGSFYGSLSNGGPVWYKFKAPSTDTYTFETTSSIDTYGELFNNIVPNGFSDGRLEYNDDAGDGSNFKFSYHLTKGQVVYLRVRGYSTSVSGTYYLKVSPSHTHSYTYEHYSSTHHKATCNCGEVTYQAHAVSSSGTNRYKPCIQCGYLVDTQNDIGIIGPTTNVKYKTNAGSYILPNGIIVLVEEDIEAYLNGTLEFNDSSMELS